MKVPGFVIDCSIMFGTKNDALPDRPESRMHDLKRLHVHSGYFGKIQRVTMSIIYLNVLDSIMIDSVAR